MIDNLIKYLKDVCFNFDINQNRKELHKGLIQEISKRLFNKDFEITLEYPLIFNSLIIRDQRKMIKQGYIDLFAKNKSNTIAIEFDSGQHLKYKSIEKLLQCNSNKVIGIVRGKEGIDCERDNINRIKDELNSSEKEFWLIILYNKKCIKI